MDGSFTTDETRRTLADIHPLRLSLWRKRRLKRHRPQRNTDLRRRTTGNFSKRSGNAKPTHEHETGAQPTLASHDKKTTSFIIAYLSFLGLWLSTPPHTKPFRDHTQRARDLSSAAYQCVSSHAYNTPFDPMESTCFVDFV